MKDRDRSQEPELSSACSLFAGLLHCHGALYATVSNFKANGETFDYYLKLQGEGAMSCAGKEEDEADN